jgi:hypothetical protein
LAPRHFDCESRARGSSFVLAALAPDVEVVSPLSGRMVFCEELGDGNWHPAPGAGGLTGGPR